MDIQFCGNGTRDNPSIGTCDEYRVSGITSIDDLTGAYRKLADTHPGFKPLFSLDDLSQARYTSGHARNNLGMGDASAQDIIGLPPACFEMGEYIGYPTTSFVLSRPIYPWLTALRRIFVRSTTLTMKACQHGSVQSQRRSQVARTSGCVTWSDAL
ncbi:MULTISPECIES: hypothetical protein [unclassified Pseudomonas]|uniref:hypothetical protein n=1 Tax=unclassified Pseudomonas TaxID=196821 RepID=UPI0030DAA106